jgi:phage terminase large subunit-like protein
VERTPGKYERLAIERQARDLALCTEVDDSGCLRGHPRGLWFDPVAAERPIQFIETLCKHHKGVWAGQPLLLNVWQKAHILRPVFGWMRPDGTRRFRTAWIEVPRKNGKTTKAGGVGLYLTVGDNEPGAEVYCTATKEDQAKILWRDASAMVKGSPDLSTWVREQKSKGGTLYCDRLGSFFKPLGSDSETLDGLNPHGHLPDEVHAHKDAGVWNVMDTGMGARRQPLTMAITTAGVFDQTAVGWQKHAYAQSVLEGAFEDDSFFAFIAALDEQDDPFAPATWAKANPNLGVSVYPSYMEGQALKAQREPAFYNDFLRLHLNQWTQQVTRWIPPEAWAACAAQPGALEGRSCCGGLDLSSKLDLAAFVLAFPGPDDVVDLLPRFWLPEARVEAEAKKGRRHYQRWVEEGLIRTTPGEVIDYGFIRAEIIEMGKKYRIEQIAYDPWNAQQLSTELGEQDGFNMVEMRQGFVSMSEPSKDFEARAYVEEAPPRGNPVLAWNVGNSVIRKDPAGNIKPDKEKAKDKIDGMVAAIMAVGRAVMQEQSVYSGDRGFLSL